MLLTTSVSVRLFMLSVCFSEATTFMLLSVRFSEVVYVVVCPFH